MIVHTQVQASRAKVDEGMVELLELLWERGYETEFSCQGGEEQRCYATGELHLTVITKAYLLFADFDNGVRFLRDVFDADPDLRPQLEVFAEDRARVTWHHSLNERILAALKELVLV